MKHKLASGFLVLILGTFMAFAQTTYQAPSLGEIDSPVTLEFWTWIGAMPETVKLFEQRYPNVKVEVVNLGGETLPKLQIALRAGSGAPDVASTQFSDLPSLVETGGLADLSNYGADAAEPYFVPWTWGQVSPDGQAVYAIPQDTGPFAMIYRKDVLDKYGIDVPTTWAEYATAAEQLDKASNGQVKIGNFFPGEASWFMALVWADNGQFFQLRDESWVQTLNNPSALKVADYWGDLIEKGYVSTYQAFSPEYWNAMSKGMIATSMEPAWGAGSFANNADKATSGLYRVAQLPQWSEGEFSTGNWGGSSTVVTTQSEHPEAATLFAIWLNTSQEAVSAGWTQGGLFPAASAGLALPVLHDSTNDPAKFFGGQDVASVFAEASRGVNTDFRWVPWLPKVSANYVKQMDAALKGDVSFAEALERWQSESLAQAEADGYPVEGQ